MPALGLKVYKILESEGSSPRLAEYTLYNGAAKDKSIFKMKNVINAEEAITIENSFLTLWFDQSGLMKVWFDLSKIDLFEKQSDTQREKNTHTHRHTHRSQGKGAPLASSHLTWQQLAKARNLSSIPVSFGCQDARPLHHHPLLSSTVASSWIGTEYPGFKLALSYWMLGVRNPWLSHYALTLVYFEFL